MDLDARFEALTQSMELLASLHKDNERRMERLIQGMEALENKGNRLEGFVTEIAQGQPGCCTWPKCTSSDWIDSRAISRRIRAIISEPVVRDNVHGLSPLAVLP
jgi:hypothetical protein